MSWLDTPGRIEVLDDFLSESYSKEILDVVDSFNQEWYFWKNVTSQGREPRDPISYGFNFHVWKENEGLTNTAISHLLLPALFQIKDLTGQSQIGRARLDMTVGCGVSKRHDPHIDNDLPNVTAIYYVNDSDGETLIFNERRPSSEYTLKRAIEPKRNRLVIFDGGLFHTGHSPLRHSNRILLNSNFF